METPHVSADWKRKTLGIYCNAHSWHIPVHWMTFVCSRIEENNVLNDGINQFDDTRWWWWVNINRHNIQMVELSQRFWPTSVHIVSIPPAPSNKGPIYCFWGKPAMRTRWMTDTAPHKSGRCTGSTTTRKQVWICDICHRQIHDRKLISIRIEHWVHQRCAGIRLAQYMYMGLPYTQIIQTPNSHRHNTTPPFQIQTLAQSPLYTTHFNHPHHSNPNTDTRPTLPLISQVWQDPNPRITLIPNRWAALDTVHEPHVPPTYSCAILTETTPPRLIILQVNINGMKNKLEELKLLIYNTHAYTITIHETKLTPKTKTPKVHNSTTVRTNRSHNTGMCSSPSLETTSHSLQHTNIRPLIHSTQNFK